MNIDVMDVNDLNIQFNDVFGEELEAEEEK